MGVDHDRAVLDIAVFLEQTRNIRLGQTGVDTSDEQVGSSVESTLLVIEVLAGINGGAIRKKLQSVWLASWVRLAS